MQWKFLGSSKCITKGINDLPQPPNPPLERGGVRGLFTVCLKGEWISRILFALLIVPVWQVRADAHGANIQYEQTEAIKIQATYDDGTPMGEAQVVIYGPDDPANPKIKGTTDSEGYFVFIPDGPGNWDVKVRQAGHGDIITIPLGEKTVVEETKVEETKTEVNNPGYTQIQKLLMAATGVWGFVGTALYFSRSKK